MTDKILSDDVNLMVTKQDFIELMDENAHQLDQISRFRSKILRLEKEVLQLTDDLAVMTRDYNSEHVEKNELQDQSRDLREQLAAAQSKEVCTVPHSDKVLEFCPYCKIEYYERLLAKETP